MLSHETLGNEKLIKLKSLAKLLAVYGVRNNTNLEDLHCGVTPSSLTGDFSDVKVVTPFGEIEWRHLSRISDEEMRRLMLGVERALEMTLQMLETLDDAGKNTVLEDIDNHRTYDRKNY